MMQNNNSNKFSNENNKLLDVVKQYLGIEHQEKERLGLSPKARRFASGQMTRCNLYYHACSENVDIISVSRSD